MQPAGGSLAAASRGIDRALGPVLLVAVALLAAGLTLPFFTVRRFVVLEDEISVLRSLIMLFEDGEYPLLALLFLFTVLFPFTKLCIAVKLWYFTDLQSDRLSRVAIVVSA